MLKLLRNLIYLADSVAEMNRKSDDSPLVGQRTGDSLPNPPRGVRAEPVASVVVEFLNGLDQSQVAFLYQIQERDSLPQVALGNAHHQPSIGLDEMIARCFPLTDEIPQPGLLFGSATVSRQDCPSVSTLFELARQSHLLLSLEEWNPGHLFEIQADGVIAGYLAQIKLLGTRLLLRLSAGILWLGLYLGAAAVIQGQQRVDARIRHELPPLDNKEPPSPRICQ